MSDANSYGIATPEKTDAVLGVDNPGGSWSVKRFLISAIFALLEETDIPAEIARLTDLADFITASSVTTLSNKETSDDFNIGGNLSLQGTEVIATAAELNVLAGITAVVAELNRLAGTTFVAADLTKLGSVTASAAELNVLDGILATVTELNKLAGVTATTAELNKLAGLTASTAELNLLTGVSSLGESLLVAAGIIVSASVINTALNGMTATAAELSALAGAGCTGAKFAILAAITATAAEINQACDGTQTRYNYEQTGVTIATTGTTIDSDLNLASVVAGDLFLVEGYLYGTKGATAGQSEILLSAILTSGADAEFVGGDTSILQSAYIGANYPYGIQVHGILKVTVGGSLAIRLAATSYIATTTGAILAIAAKKIKSAG